MLLENYQLPRS
jgi:hypothetical protein